MIPGLIIIIIIIIFLSLSSFVKIKRNASSGHYWCVHSFIAWESYKNNIRCNNHRTIAIIPGSLRSCDDYDENNNMMNYYLTPTLSRIQKRMHHLRHTKTIPSNQRGIRTSNPKKNTNTTTLSYRTLTNEYHYDWHDNTQTTNCSIFIDDGLLASKLGLDPNTNIRHAPMVYHELYSCPNWPERQTFPMEKFHQMAMSLLNHPDLYLNGMSNDNDDDDDGGDKIIMNEEEEVLCQQKSLVLSKDHFYRPLCMEKFPKTFLCPPICSQYLQSFLTGTLSSEECRLIGFREQTSRPELIERTVLEVAGTILTAQLALRYGLASNLAGGTHHAERSRGKGYTILNDLAVVAHLMTWKEDDNAHQGQVDDDNESNESDRALLRQLYRGDGNVDRVLVVDCDVHQGDGTATFARAVTSTSTSESTTILTSPCANSLQNKLFTLDLHAMNNYPHPKEVCTYDIGLLDGCDDATYLSTLTQSLEKALREVNPQLVLYNAGVDVFQGDKLGRLSLSMEGIRERDSHVIRTCVDSKIPIAVVVGGGYDDDVKELGNRHALVHRVCAEIWREMRVKHQINNSVK